MSLSPRKNTRRWCTPEMVREIFFRKYSGQTIQQIAHDMGLAYACVAGISSGARHKDQIEREGLRVAPSGT